jgi:opacity protein-like surface antigen
MKKLLFLAAFLISLQLTQAQTDKGDWMVGGTLGFNTAKNSANVTFDPQVGYFFLKNLVLGGQINLSYTEQGSIHFTDIGVGPFARYYFGETKARPFFTGDMSFINNHFKTETSSGTSQAFGYFLGGGASFFINENVAVDGILGYRHVKYKNEDGTGGLNFKLGFQVFLSHRQVSRITGH